MPRIGQPTRLYGPATISRREVAKEHGLNPKLVAIFDHAYSLPTVEYTVPCGGSTSNPLPVIVRQQPRVIFMGLHLPIEEDQALFHRSFPQILKDEGVVTTESLHWIRTGDGTDQQGRKVPVWDKTRFASSNWNTPGFPITIDSMWVTDQQAHALLEALNCLASDPIEAEWIKGRAPQPRKPAPKSLTIPKAEHLLALVAAFPEIGELFPNLLVSPLEPNLPICMQVKSDAEGNYFAELVYNVRGITVTLMV
ncbi:MAG: hypothetical protein WC890_07585 [Candidatus Margulisiibacteriota bacterium]